MKKNYITPTVDVLDIEKDSFIATSVYENGEADPNVKYNEDTKNDYIWESGDFKFE